MSVCGGLIPLDFSWLSFLFCFVISLVDVVCCAFVLLICFRYVLAFGVFDGYITGIFAWFWWKE